jgi:hypothetical protein
VASVASGSDAVGPPFAGGSGQEGSVVAPVEFGGKGEDVADIVVEIHTEGSVAEGTKKVEVVAAQMVAARVVVESATVDEKIVNVEAGRSVELSRQAETAENAAAHRKGGQGLQAYLEDSVPRPVLQRAVVHPGFR